MNEICSTVTDVTVFCHQYPTSLVLSYIQRCYTTQTDTSLMASFPGQLSLLPSAWRKMSTGQSVVTLCS